MFRQEVLKKPGGKEILVSGRPDNHDVNWINDQIQDLLAVSLHSLGLCLQVPDESREWKLKCTCVASRWSMQK